MAVMVPVNSVVSTLQKNLIYAQMRNKDRRSRLMDEILNGMKVLKLYAWEESFERTITAIRGEQLDLLSTRLKDFKLKSNHLALLSSYHFVIDFAMMFVTIESWSWWR